jgi:hypothetical protein
MSGERSFFTELSGISPGSWPINCIGGKLPHAVGMGTIKLTTSVNGANVNGELKNALYVPGLGVTLISIAYLSISGYAVFFSGLNAIVERDNTIIMTASRSGETLYKVKAVVITHQDSTLAAATCQTTLNVWHERLGHANRRIIQRMASGIEVMGMLITPGSPPLNECCHGCHVGKMHKQPFIKSTTIYENVGDCIVSDLVGPFQVDSVGGARYYALFKDVYSKYKTVYFLKHKSETADCFLNFVKTVFTATGRHVQLLRCDGGTEFINNYLKNQLSLIGIQLQTSAPYTPEQNGIAERDHRSTVESARSQIHAKGVPLKLWAEAINYSVYVLNRTISKSETITPYQRLFGKSPDISNLRVFGSVAYFFTPDVLRQKLDPKATKGVYVGESEEQKASRVFVEATGRTHISRHLKVMKIYLIGRCLNGLFPHHFQPTVRLRPTLQHLMRVIYLHPKIKLSSLHRWFNLLLYRFENLFVVWFLRRCFHLK